MSSVLEDKDKVLGFLLPWKLFRLRDGHPDVAGHWIQAGRSILFGVIQIFQWPNPSGRTVALGSTVPLTEMSTRNIFRGLKAAGA